jgi:DNA-binding NarL/FixJ family response regulator
VFIKLSDQPRTTTESRRLLVAEFCRVLAGTRAAKLVKKDPSPGDGLSRRLGQTFECLLAGDSEKQVAAKLGLSQHTIHVYVKALYKHFKVATRAELLARHIKR